MKSRACKQEQRQKSNPILHTHAHKEYAGTKKRSKSYGYVAGPHVHVVVRMHPLSAPRRLTIQAENLIGTVCEDLEVLSLLPLQIDCNLSPLGVCWPMPCALASQEDRGEKQNDILHMLDRIERIETLFCLKQEGTTSINIHLRYRIIFGHSCSNNAKTFEFSTIEPG